MTTIKAEDIVGLDYAIETHPDIAPVTDLIHSETHVVSSHSDTDITGAQIEELCTDDYTTLHEHDNWVINDEEGFIPE